MKKATIRSLTAKGYSQKKIAKILHIRKTKVVVAQRALKVGKRSTFGKDVAKMRKDWGYDYRESVKKTSMTPKWLSKRVARLTEEEQAMHKFWKDKTREFRRQQFKAGTFNLSEKLLLDYELYFSTEA
jgi:DNA-binding transcriptional MerR regulator